MGVGVGDVPGPDTARIAGAGAALKGGGAGPAPQARPPLEGLGTRPGTRLFAILVLMNQ